MNQILIEKKAQIAILNALLVQLCSCECESRYVEKLRNQLQKEYDALESKDKT